MDYSSKFSPYLALGCLSARFIYHETKRYERERTSNQSTYWLIFELLWRDYFHFVARKYGSSLFLEGGIKNQPNRTRRSEKLIRAWKEGQTGNPFVDANMRELKATGYMSNRGRQNVASYFVKDLNQDWRVGAAWFESMLLDYDPCSNYGNWNYIAGIGNDPRENRYFNTVKQAHNYDGKGVYTHHWLPELSSLQPPFLFQPELADKGHLEKLEIVLGKTYPFPVAEISQKTLFS
jgi:deoxyribodipyrimidine photo-lyase